MKQSKKGLEARCVVGGVGSFSLTKGKNDRGVKQLYSEVAERAGSSGWSWISIMNLGFFLSTPVPTLSHAGLSYQLNHKFMGVFQIESIERVSKLNQGRML